MKKYDLLLLALYGIILTILLVGGYLDIIIEQRQAYDYFTDLKKKEINVVMIEDTKLPSWLKKVKTPLKGGGYFEILGRLQMDYTLDFRVKNDTLFIGKKAIGNIHMLRVGSHMQVDILDATNIHIPVNSNLKYDYEF